MALLPILLWEQGAGYGRGQRPSSVPTRYPSQTLPRLTVAPLCSIQASIVSSRGTLSLITTRESVYY